MKIFLEILYECKLLNLSSDDVFNTQIQICTFDVKEV